MFGVLDGTRGVVGLHAEDDGGAQLLAGGGNGLVTIAAAGKKLRPAIVLGVQAGRGCHQVRQTRAAKVGADAVISLPLPENADPKTDLEYYKAVCSTTILDSRPWGF